MFETAKKYREFVKNEVSKLKPFFDKFNNDKTPVDYKYDGYSENMKVTFYGVLDVDTIMDLVAAGYKFNVQPFGDNWLRVNFE